MKKREMFMCPLPSLPPGGRSWSPRGRRGVRCHRHDLRRYRRARPEALQPVDYDPLAAAEPGGDDAQPVRGSAELDLPRHDLAVLADHQDETPVLVGADRA